MIKRNRTGIMASGLGESSVGWQAGARATHCSSSWLQGSRTSKGIRPLRSTPPPAPPRVNGVGSLRKRSRDLDCASDLRNDDARSRIATGVEVGRRGRPIGSPLQIGIWRGNVGRLSETPLQIGSWQWNVGRLSETPLQIGSWRGKVGRLSETPLQIGIWRGKVGRLSETPLQISLPRGESASTQLPPMSMGGPRGVSPLPRGQRA